LEKSAIQPTKFLEGFKESLIGTQQPGACFASLVIIREISSILPSSWPQILNSTNMAMMCDDPHFKSYSMAQHLFNRFVEIGTAANSMRDAAHPPWFPRKFINKKTYNVKSPCVDQRQEDNLRKSRVSSIVSGNFCIPNCTGLQFRLTLKWTSNAETWDIH